MDEFLRQSGNLTDLYEGLESIEYIDDEAMWSIHFPAEDDQDEWERLPNVGNNYRAHGRGWFCQPGEWCADDSGLEKKRIDHTILIIEHPHPEYRDNCRRQSPRYQ